MKGPKMSPSDTHGRLSGLKDRYDIIVIGGGIQGATMVWEAASRGLSVLLIEQNDFGSGVSANSLKVIHGGIRYLQNLDIGRMRQSIRERRALLRIAPHLVTPMRCIIPAYRSLGKGRFALWMGTRLYDLASADRNRGLDPARRIGRSDILSTKEFEDHIPEVSPTEIAGGALWHDATAHNSERLVLAFVLSAKDMGSDVCNYVRAEEIIHERGRVRGIIARDVLSGDMREVLADVVMDCSGPWFGKTPAGSGMHYARAMNLVIRRRFADCAFGIKRNGIEKRTLFFTPWRDGGIVGTWYDQVHVVGDPSMLTVSKKTISAALAEINRGLGGRGLQMEEVTAVHLGLLPAQPNHQDADEPALSDRFQIIDGAGEGAAGLFHIQGVKYTTARDISVRALKAAERYLSAIAKPSITHITPLHGGNVGDVDRFQNECLKRYVPDFPRSLVTRLMKNYGTLIHSVLGYANSAAKLAAPVPGAADVLQAELTYVLDNEMVSTLSDLLFRRTDLGSFAMPAEETIEFCANFMANCYSWDTEMRKQNMETLYNQLPRWIQAVQ